MKSLRLTVRLSFSSDRKSITRSRCYQSAKRETCRRINQKATGSFSLRSKWICWECESYVPCYRCKLLQLGIWQKETCWIYSSEKLDRGWQWTHDLRGRKIQS